MAAFEMPTAAPAQVQGALGTGDTIGIEPSVSTRGEIWRRFRRNRLAVVGLAIIVIMVMAAVFAPLVTSYDPTIIDTDTGKAGPTRAHWFGTDLLGRDLFTRVVYGARVSLQVGIFASLIAVSLGVALGAVSGYYGGKVDALVMRSTDVFLAFPYILAAIVIISVLGRGQGTVILVLGLIGWMSIARVFRSSILQIKETEYIQAARAMGCSDARIILRHILPNAIQPVIVLATIFIGSAVLSEAALSFLGVGITEPTPAWGLMVGDGKRFLFTDPHMLFFPGLAIFVTVMAFVFVGDGLRDALDPRLR